MVSFIALLLLQKDPHKLHLLLRATHSPITINMSFHTWIGSILALCPPPPFPPWPFMCAGQSFGSPIFLMPSYAKFCPWNASNCRKTQRNQWIFFFIFDPRSLERFSLQGWHLPSILGLLNSNLSFFQLKSLPCARFEKVDFGCGFPTTVGITTLDLK